MVADDQAEYDSAEQFVRCALYMDARYAIPFASNHCFLHRDTQQFNVTATTPEDVRRLYERIAAQTGSKSQCVVMPPGSAWNDRDGFAIAPFDFSDRDRYIAGLLERHREQLERTYEAESKVAADFVSFKDYFDAFIAATPGIVRRRILSRLVFRIRDVHGVHHWLIDPHHSKVGSLTAAPNDCIVIDVHPKVINDCVAHKMFSVWSASKRLRIHLPEPNALAKMSSWFTLLDFYEVDMLPLHKNLTSRALEIRLRRWREPVEVARILFRRLVLRRRFSVGDVYRRRPDPLPAR